MASIERILYELAGRPESIVAYLDSTSFDELIEIDFVSNEFHNLAHVEGKFFVPVLDGEFRDLFLYSGNNMVHPDDQAAHDTLMDRDTIFDRLEESQTPGIISSEIRYRLKDGGYHWTREVVVGGAAVGVEPGVVRVYIYDIQSMKERELGPEYARAEIDADIRDELTGLRHEREFIAAVQSQRSNSSYRNWCIAVMDIDQFKLFNEWYGRKAGDFVLAKIGAYLTQREESDGWMAAYLGQDDFCVLMPLDDDVIQGLYKDVSKVIADSGASMTFYPMIGVCKANRRMPVYDLMDRAKMAAESAKKDMKRHIRYFEDSMQERSEAEYRLLTDFEQAMANRDIRFALQPQCDIATGQIVGVEALARWIKPDGEVIPPSVFIPALEKSGFICDLDRYIWNSVCASVRSWINAGNEPVPVSVNVSRQDIYEFDVTAYFQGLLHKYGLKPSHIKIEITESAYIDDENRVGETVKRLRERGFLVMMDDFGSGYSSLNTLDSINVDAIKLDMTFMRMSDEGKRKSIRIIESMVNMANMLDLMVIAEGVEEKDQAEFLQSIGCHYVQGFYFYKPMYPEEFEHLITEGGGSIDTRGITIKRNEEFRMHEFLDQNVYSDSMLNSILGPLAIYSWHGDDVDILRYNEQFYEEIGIESLQDHLERNQSYVDPKDLMRYYNLLVDAMEDELNGATNVIRYRTLDNTPFDILLHFYYLGETDGGKRFYGTVRNVTQLTELLEQQHLLSAIATQTIVFIRKHGDGWHFTVGVYGNEEQLGLSRADIERELEDRSFLDRLDAPVARMVEQMMIDGNNPTEDFGMPFNLRLDNGEKIQMSLKCHCVRGAQSSFSYILVMS